MFKSAATFLTLCVFLWILPLGAFIKPSQEEAACGGKRAFHMCCMMEGKAGTGEDSGKISFSNPSGIEKHNSPGSSGDDLNLEYAAALRRDPSSSFMAQADLFQSPLLDLSLDQPPKTLLF